MSKQKRLILDVIRSGPGHMTAAQIFELARGTMPGISLSTVYRNLGVLVQEGLIRSFSNPESPMFYDANLAEHDHLICSSCGEITDICSIRGIIEAQIGQELDQTGISVYYLCPKCRKQQGQ